MNRRRTKPARSASVSGDDTMARATASGLDEDVAQAFFRDGLSEDALTAVSERQREHETLSSIRAARNGRWVYGAAALGAGMALLLYLVPKPVAKPPVVVAVTQTALAQPAAVAAAPAADGEGVANEATATAAGSVIEPPAAETAHVVGMKDLRAGAVPPTDDTAAVADETTAARPVRSKDATNAAVAAISPTSASATPGNVLAEAAPRSGAQQAKEACEQLLRRGKFADIKTSCARAFSADPNAALAVEIARHALEREHYGDAQTWAHKAIALDKAHGEAFLTLGGAEQGLGHAARARTAYTRYLELEPQGAYADDVRALINSL